MSEAEMALRIEWSELKERVAQLEDALNGRQRTVFDRLLDGKRLLPGLKDALDRMDQALQPQLARMRRAA